jgi:phenylacetic acid degradation operon negative regulatory protein
MNARAGRAQDGRSGDPPSRASIRTQFLIFTLFGDYVLPRGGTIWTGSLLHLLGLLEVSERAARSTLSRMLRKGWLIARKQGRRSQYSLTARGWALLEEGGRRIFEPRFTDWDGLWHLVSYSLPEDKRDLRHALRQRLAWLGFGPLASGTWLSPHDRKAEVESACRELGVDAHVEIFAGMHQGLSADQALVRRCWDLSAVEGHYREFIARYAREYQDARAWPSGRPALSPEQCFVRRFWLTHDFQKFPRQDPNLPTELHEPDWIGYTARDLFEGYRRLLGEYANAYVDAVLAGEAKPVAVAGERFAPPPGPASGLRRNGRRIVVD